MAPRPFSHIRYVACATTHPQISLFVSPCPLLPDPTFVSFFQERRPPWVLCSFPITPSLKCSDETRTPRPRKPAGYWSNLDNLRRELEQYTHDSAAPLPYVMPKASDLRAAGRRDLDNAIAKTGGYRAVAQLLGWAAKSTRRPPGYWTEFCNLESELMDYIAQHQMLDAKAPLSNISHSCNIMPTQRELRAERRSDLAEAIMRHGGFVTVSERLNLQRRTPKKAKHYWKDWQKVESEVRAFVRERNKNLQNSPGDERRKNRDKMPSQQEMRVAGRADLAEAISDHHGGFRVAAKKLGFVSKKKDDFFYKHFYNLAAEVYAFAKLQGGNTVLMPTTTVLKAEGRTDIAAAIVMHGGMAKVSQRLGLQYRLRTKDALKDWGLFRRALLSFMKKHCDSDVIPSSRTLINYGRADLYQALLHHGGVREVSDRIGLKRSHWQDFHNVGPEVLQFVRTHGTEGVMPTEQEFLNVGRKALNVAVGKFSHSQVAKRLGLSEPYQSPQKALDTFLNYS